MTHTSTRFHNGSTSVRILGSVGLGMALLLGASSVSRPAQSQTICFAHVDLVKELHSKHSEAPVSIGLARNGGLIEVFSTDDGSTWTIVITKPDGTSCVMATGEAWENVPVTTRGRQA